MASAQGVLLTPYSSINTKILLSVQFVDDMLDFTSSSSTLGKPALNDLKSGLATAPVLYAAQEFPELKPMILRKFKLDGDVTAAQKLVFRSQGIQMTRDLAAEHAGLAADAVRILAPFLVQSSDSIQCSFLSSIPEMLSSISILNHCYRQNILNCLLDLEP